MPKDASNAPVVPTQRPSAEKRYFSVADANRAMKYVSRVVEDLSPCYTRVLAYRHRLEKPADGDNREQIEADYDREMDRLSNLMDELQQVGVEIRNLERCVIDFPAHHQGREIFLSWHRGEPGVSRWHEADAEHDTWQDITLLDAA